MQVVLQLASNISYLMNLPFQPTCHIDNQSIHWRLENSLFTMQNSLANIWSPMAIFIQTWGLFQNILVLCYTFILLLEFLLYFYQDMMKCVQMISV